MQEALIDLGHDLGPMGADGIYGPRTASAVRQFKAQQKLGFEQFGDVGPGTMGRLNELFPAPAPPVDENPPKDVAEEDDTACPFGVDDLETAVTSTLTSKENSALAFGPSQSTPSVGPTPHLSIGQAVERFQQQVNVAGVATGGPVDKNVTDRGQFFWSLQVSDAIAAELTRMNAVPSAQPFVAKARAAHAAIKGGLDASALLVELDAIAKTSTSREKAAMKAVLAKDLSGGTGHELRLWEAYIKDDTNSLPDLRGSRSLRVFRSMKKAEKTACWSHAMFVARKLKKKGGMKPRDKSVKVVNARVAGFSGVRDRRPDPPGSTTHKGDVIPQPAVAGIIPGLKAALDAGQVVHARVLSGVGYGTVPRVPAEPRSKVVTLPAPPEEHSLLIIGFDDNKFVFSDPDAAVSNHPVPGFGLLFFDGKRLSTAESDSTLPVSDGGEHKQGATKDDKRYQIISLVTV